MKERKSYHFRLICHEQFEIPSGRLGVLTDRGPHPHICIVQSDRLVSRQRRFEQQESRDSLKRVQDIRKDRQTFPDEMKVGTVV